MPFAIRKMGSVWKVVNTTTNDVKGTFQSKAKAQKQLNLLRAIKNNPDFKPRK